MPERKSFVVAAYDVAMAFGGREEGGWWYDRGSLIRVLRVFPNEDRAYEYSRKLNTRLRSREFGPNQGRREYSSVFSDGEVRAIVCDTTAPAGFPERRPRYE